MTSEHSQRERAGIAPEPQRAITARVRGQTPPRQQIRRQPTAIGIANPNVDMLPLAQKIVSRIRNVRHVTVAGCYVLADEHMQVFVLPECQRDTDRRVKASQRHVVGRYCAGDKPTLPSAQDMFDDLLQHFIDLGVLTVAMIYDEIRGIEA